MGGGIEKRAAMERNYTINCKSGYFKEPIHILQTTETESTKARVNVLSTMRTVACQKQIPCGTKFLCAFATCDDLKAGCILILTRQYFLSRSV